MAYSYTGDVDLYGTPLKVGITTYGTVNITGGYESAYSMIIGDTATGVGYLNITGNSTFDISDSASISDNQLIVGHYGTGHVSVTDGELVILGGNYNGLLVGNKAGSVGTVLVSGSNASLAVESTAASIRIGNYGTGTLTIQNGGYVDSLILDVGRKNGAVGTVNIDGAGSELVLNNLYGRAFSNPLYAGEAAFGRIGRESGSAGYLNITNGGLLQLSNLHTITDNPAFQIARNDGSYGKAVVDGLGSEFNIIQHGPNGDSYTPFSNLDIGRNGQGILQITNQGSVSVTGDQVSVSVSRANSSDTVVDPASSLYIGSGGDMLIDAENGYGGTLFVGANTNSRGSVTVTGTGSTLTINGTYGGSSYRDTGFLIGENGGSGSLTISDNAVVTLTGNETGLDVGYGYEFGGLYATTTESQVYITSGGKLNISSTGNDYGSFVALGGAADGNGYMLIDGAGSQLNLSSSNNGVVADEGAFMDVGEYGEGTLYITGGGALSISGGVNDGLVGIATGIDNGSYGRTTVTGYGGGASSKITVTGTNGTTGGSVGVVAVGVYGGSDGGLTISNAGEVLNDTEAAFTAVGIRSGASGYVTVEGSYGSYASTLDGGTLMIVGADFAFDTADFSAVSNTISSVNYLTGGTGTVSALNGGIVRADEIVVGDGGRLEGNSTFDGNVTVDGTGYGAIAPGGTGRVLTITGSLDLADGTLEMDIDGVGAGQFDEIDVTGAATLTNGDIQIAIGAAYTPTAGDTLVILSGGGGVTFAAENFDLSASGSTLAFQIADTGTELQFKALNGGSGAAVVNFGAASTTSASATIIGTEGYGAGGDFDSLAFIGATALNGTAVADNFDASAATTALTLSGLGGNDTLTTGSGADTLNGGTGADTMTGGADSDSYFVDDTSDVIIELAAGGTTDVVRSTATYTLSGNIEQLRLQGSADINATGNAENNLLIGNSGGNRLNGSTGADTMQGGDGDDIYFVDNAGDVVVEGSNLGTDQVQSSISITLASNIENGLLLTSANLNLTGNAFGNTLFGNAGNNTLDGGAGVDVMAGGAGDDTYIVDLPSDFISEQAAAGTDSVQSTVNYSLRPNIENLTLLGTANLQGIGNAENNILIGNSGANRLNGSLGADTMTGGDGNDIYSVDDAGDVVIESANEGVDTVLSFATQTLGANVERLYLFGTADINATGNGDNNGLLGNDGDNALSGEGGNDLLFGGLGNDTMTGGAGNDSFFFHTALDGVNNVETLIDFSHADDTMRLDSAVFTGLSTGLLSSSAFIIGTAAGDADDRIIYDDTTGDLFFDADGNGAGAQVQFANLDDMPTDVAFNDFLVF